MCHISFNSHTYNRWLYAVAGVVCVCLCVRARVLQKRSRGHPADCRCGRQAPVSYWSDSSRSQCRLPF